MGLGMMLVIGLIWWPPLWHFAVYCILLCYTCLIIIHCLYPPQTVFVGGYTVFTLSVRPNERTNERKCVRNVLFL